MYETILVPTDGSDPSEEAAEHAVDVASRYGATVHALFVVDQTGPGGHWDMVVERQEERGEAAVEAVAALGEAAGVPASRASGGSSEQSSDGVAVEKHIRRGVPHEEIVDAAADYGADLIVIGTHGRTGFDRIAAAGSTTERVVRLTTVPTLVVGGAGRGR